MSPQVKVSYFRKHEDSVLGHSMLYLTGVGTYHLPGSGTSPHPSVLAVEGLREALSGSPWPASFTIKVRDFFRGLLSTLEPQGRRLSNT